MSTTLVLKDASGADITLAYIGSTNDGLVFERVSSTLVGRLRAVVTLTEGQKTNRVRGKLTAPSVTTLPDSGAIPVVQYTEIGSFDFSIFRGGATEGRSDLAAMLASLMTNPVVTNAIVDGVKPSK